MKHILFTTVFVVAFSVTCFAQTTETFDIATFQPPGGWKKQTKPGLIIFTSSNEQTRSYAMIMLYASGVSKGDARSDFDRDWQEFIAGPFGVKGKPAIEPADKKDGWDVVSGGTAFENEMGTAAVILSTYSGFGKTFSAAAIFNDENNFSAIDAFASSIKLNRPEPGIQPKQIPDMRSGSQPSVTQSLWKQSQSRRDMGGYAGYSQNTYQFNANGTYRFSRVDFQNYTPKYYLENEEGTYEITGNRITITPRKAIFSSHKVNKEDPPLKTGNLGLTVVQYSFEIINLNDNWTLLLSPIDGNETRKDGTFSFWLNGEKRRTYSYNSVNAAGELIR